MTNQSIRILGLSKERVTDFREQPHSKSGGLYAALDRRFNVVGVLRPELSTIQYYYNKLRYIHPNRDYWRQQANLNPAVFRKRLTVIERELTQWQKRFDIIVQLHTLVAAGIQFHKRLFVLHTDNTYLLSEQYYPEWAPLRRRERDERVQIEREVFQHAAFLFPRSDWLRRSLIEDYGCEPERVIRVGGGANVTVVSLEHKRYDRQIALFVGFDFKRKGGFTLLEAWPAVRQKLPDAQLWIVGPEKPLAVEQPGVRWMGRISDRRILSNIYQEATLFVMPSLFDPWGHVFFEAMGHGLACIGTNHCAMPEIIQHNETGLLVPPVEPEPLAEALVAILGDSGFAERLGRRAHADVEHGHTWDDVVDRMVPYIEQAVADGRRRSLSTVHEGSRFVASSTS